MKQQFSKFVAHNPFHVPLFFLFSLCSLAMRLAAKYILFIVHPVESAVLYLHQTLDGCVPRHLCSLIAAPAPFGAPECDTLELSATTEPRVRNPLTDSDLFRYRPVG